MRVRIEKSTAFGKVFAPPSKSAAIRLLVCAALARGESVIGGVGDCEDTQAALRCLSALSVSVRKEGDLVRVFGKGREGLTPVSPLDCGESATVLRLLIPLCLTLDTPVFFTGKGRLFQRTLDEYGRIADSIGAVFIKKEDGLLLKGALTGGEYTLSGGVSSQFVSGLALALSVSAGQSVITVMPPVCSRPYIDMTRETLALFGGETEWTDERTLFVRGGELTPCSARVEGDHSAAAFFYALNAFGGEVEVAGLRKESRQGDKVCPRLLEALCKGKAEIDLSDTPDLAPVLFAVAAAKHGGVFLGTERLKEKESDRAQAMKEELEKCGARVTVKADRVEIEAAEPYPPKTPLLGHNDHRIVMALSVLLTALGGELEGAEAVKKSYPDFFAALEKLNVKVLIG